MFTDLHHIWDVWDDTCMSIEKLPSGKYRAVVRHEGRKNRSKSVATQAEAKILDAQLTLSMGAAPKNGGHTVVEIILGFIEDGVATKSPSTTADYRKGEAALSAAFKGREASDVSVYIIDNEYKAMRRAGDSEHKIKKAHKLLSASFNRAVTYGWISTNPCQLATKPRPVTKEITPPSPDAVRAIISASRPVNADLAVYLRLMAATGMRRGEGCGLKWEDFDFDNDTVLVRRNLVEDGRKVVVRETKTGSKGKRRIDVDHDTMAELGDLRERQATSAADHHLPVPVWVFSHDAGLTPWTPSYTTRAFGRLSKAYRLHDFRHFYATQLLARGLPIAEVSRRLGHSSVTVTLNTYSHWLPENDRRAADLVGELLAGR